MTTKELTPIEQETYPAIPTTLHLFRYKGPQLDHVNAIMSAVLQFGNNFEKTEASLHRLNAAKDARLNRISQTSEELSEQLDNIGSSIACSAVYLKMRDELQSLPPQEFMTFFKQCLAVNTRFCERLKARTDKEEDQTTFFTVINMINTRQLHPDLKKILGEMTDNLPSWFVGDKTDWQTFALLHVNFIAYLNHDFFLNLAPRPGSALKDILNRIDTADTLYGATKEGEFPDWFLEGSKVMPTKEEVEEELAEDKEQETKTKSALEKIEKQKDYLVATSLEKTQKATERLRNLATEVIPSFQNFLDLIFFKKVLDKKSDIIPLKSDSIEMAIKSYTDPENILKNQEPIALYIEKKLQEGKIIESTQDPIDANFTDLFTRMVKYLKEKEDSSSAEFQELRSTNKKAFEALNYDIRPFLELLLSDELSFLQDLLMASNGKPIELFIWDLAGLISSRFKQIKNGELGKSQRGAIHYLQRFTNSFLKNHSTWLYESLQNSLSNNSQEREELKPEDSLVTTNLQEEIKSTTEEIAQGNLAGWQILYTDNKSRDQKHLTEIGGGTLEERELALQDFFLKQGVSSSIKPGSIIRALDWIVTVPENIEQLRIRKGIGGEIFRKIKRGSLRIFYQMSWEKKELIFFVHQKQAWRYGF